ncbi:tudor domain-containing protein 1 isoform X2 [Halyomorpha halys]|nr:tudor domain-containing protein 1 isoform X2 [Halyomorpha halys]
MLSCSDLDSNIGFSKPKRKRKAFRAMLCNECGDNPSDYHCKQCEAPYCQQCFKLVHASAKAFRNHVRMSLLDSYLCLDADLSMMCLNHTKHKLEFFCIPCHTAACSHCLVELHNGHAVDKIENVEFDFEEEFIQRYMDVSNIVTRMKSSKKLAENILHNEKDISEIKKTEEEITEYFLLLHGKLSLIEHNLRKKLSSVNTRRNLEEILKQVTGYIEDAETILASTRTLFSDGSAVGPKCLAVIDNLKSRQQLPCYLIESASWVEPRFSADKDFIKTLENHCDLKLVEEPRYQLVPKEKVPTEYTVSPTKDLTRDEVLKLLRKPYLIVDSSPPSPSEGTPSPSSPPSLASEKSYSSQTRDHSSHALLYPDEIALGCSLRVRISHLISPSHFYVQRENAQKKLLEFQASLRTSQLQQCKPPYNLEKGKVYLTLYGADSKWYRARITNIIDPMKFEVFYVDYGNSEIVDKSRIRTIPKSSLNMSCLAYRCQLSDCVPRYGDDWDAEAISLMTEIMDEDFVTITVLDKTNVAYLVDLHKVTENSFINLRQSLVFHELASMTKMLSQTTDINVQQTLTTPSQHKYTEGSVFEGHISHVESPHAFYIQDITNCRKLAQMTEDLQRTYNIKNKQNNAIYDPKKGMLVAACYSKDSKWYRGKIVDYLEGRKVKIFFIDFGNEETLICDNIKLLSQRFCSLPAQALKCTLSDVYPLNGKDWWDEEICTKFHELIFDKQFKLLVDSIANGELAVVLYQVSKELDTCINAKIVKEGLAMSTGPNSVLVEFPKISGEPIDPTFQIMAVEKKRVNKKIVKPNKLDSESPLSDDFFVMMPEGVVRTKVIVKTIHNPGEFYVMPTCFRERTTKLKFDLQEFYGNRRLNHVQKEWNIDDRCVVNCDGIWHRAIISELLPNDFLIKVNLIDEGCEKIVDCKNIEIMDNIFAEIPDGVVKCHLGGIEPTLNTWSALSVSEFEEFVNNRKESLFISQLGKIKNESLPVELFSRIPLEVGPTEPMKDDWKSVNHYLRFIGLAKADGMIEWDSDGKILNMPEDNDCLSILDRMFKDSMNLFEENVENSYMANIVEHGGLMLKSWLPPEPLTNLEFIAAPTYVDENGIVYLHDFHKSEKILQEISSALGTKYDNSVPRLHDSTIEEGDICVAKYHLDNKWYRAVLLGKCLETSEYTIQFVDYGNVETCKLGELRKIPVAQHIPIQSYRCCFHTVKPMDPSGMWKQRDVEIIQYYIVDKNCQIKLVKIPGSDLFGIEQLKLPEGCDYVAEMVRDGLAIYRNFFKNTKDVSDEIGDNNDEVVNTKSESETVCDTIELKPVMETVKIEELNTIENEVKKTPILHWSSILNSLLKKEMPKLVFKNFEIPPVVKSLIVDVTAFLSPIQLILHIEDVEEDPVVLKMLEEFKELSNEMQIEGPNQPLLQHPYKYKACCAKFSLDKKWYRGFVLEELPDDMMLVQYVDYGNVEVVPGSCVHELKEEWTNIEVQGILCTLHNVAMNENYNASEILHSVQDCLEEGTVKANIIDRNPDLSVELLIDEKLAYQKLIDLKMFNLIN